MSQKQSALQSPASTSHVRPIRVFALIDALGWTYIQGRDFLNDILPYRTSVRTVLGFSSGAIPTILTGVPPSQNNHWNLYYYDPQGSPFRWLRHFGFLPEAVWQSRVTSKLLKEMGRRFLGLGPLFECAVNPRFLPWFNWVERKNIYDYGGITGAPSIFDRLAERKIPHRIYTYHHWTDKQIVEQARQDLLHSDATFLFLYLCEMDGFLHMHCADEKQIDEKLQWYAGALRDLFALAQSIDPEATLTVASDHGMTPITKHYDLMSDIERLPLRMPQDYLAVYDSTMARFWFFTDQARRQIGEVLAANSSGRILPDDELRQLGVWFEDRRYGELVFLLHPGWLIARSGFNSPRWMPSGMHGYHPADPYSDAIFLSSRPPSSRLETIADVHRCMLEAVA